MIASSGPLGVFDSGVGGLTVVGALLRRLPGERILYVADQAHVPYGERPLDEIARFASEISAFLAAQGCRAIIMACNISSATALSSVSATLAPLPVLGVIAPAVRRALCTVGRGNAPRIGVLATEGTVRSGAYSENLHRIAPSIEVIEIACPQFVPLVESGRTESEESDSAAHRYLAPLAQAGCDTIILGCTHYPFLLPALRRAAADLFPYSVTFIDPADEMVDALRTVLPDVGIASPAPSDCHLLMTTGSPDAFRIQTSHFLPDLAFDAYEVASACWTAFGQLTLPSVAADNRRQA